MFTHATTRRLAQLTCGAFVRKLSASDYPLHFPQATWANCRTPTVGLRTDKSYVLHDIPYSEELPLKQSITFGITSREKQSCAFPCWLSHYCIVIFIENIWLSHPLAWPQYPPWTVPMGLISNFSTSTLATFGERKAGRVGPRRMPLTPRKRRASRTATAFCSYQAMS